MDKRYFKWFLIVGILALMASQLYVRPETRALLSYAYWSNLMRYGSVLRLIESEYVDPEAVDYARFTDAALNGGLKELDAYSSYFAVDAYHQFQEETEQRYVGVGIEIGYFEDKAIVTDVFSEGSAGTAGVAVGDVILAVDEETVSEEKIGQLIDAIRGEPDTEVVLTLARIGEVDPVNIRIVRRQIDLSSVTDVSLEDVGVGYLRVRQFTEETDVELRAAIEKLIGLGMRGLMIDLRGNPGGRLDTAVRMAELFLEPGKTILKVQSRRGVEEFFESKGSDFLYRGPLVVMIDGQSASASEIFAGALRDLDRAVLVGATSYGKGSVQSVIGFSDGTGLKLTSARYLLPGGAVVQGVGVEPTVFVEIGETDRMRNLLLRHLAGTISTAELEAFYGFEPQADAVLAAAKEALAQRMKIE